MSDFECHHEGALCTGIEYVFGDITEMDFVSLTDHLCKVESLFDVLKYVKSQAISELNERIHNEDFTFD